LVLSKCVHSALQTNMNTENILRERSSGQCELCNSETNLSVYEIPPHSDGNEEDSILVCEKCSRQLNKKEELDNKQWSCLSKSMWSEVTAVQVVTWRMLNRPLRGQNPLPIMKIPLMCHCIGIATEIFYMMEIM
jgi:hypothetical protein